VDETFRSSTYSQIETKHAQDIMSIPIGHNPLIEKPKLKAANTTVLEPIEKTVLVVDDNNYNLFILQKLLDIIRYKHESAFNGLEAINKVKAKGNSNYCLIIMDLNMPILNGFDASLQIIGLIEKKEVPQVPIVMLTAQDDSLLKEKCLQAGLKDFFEKPITMEKLKYMVEKYAI
jgi:CheY-like chemotaxis protein